MRLAIDDLDLNEYVVVAVAGTSPGGLFLS
jgi:hypothetical protein